MYILDAVHGTLTNLEESLFLSRGARMNVCAPTWAQMITRDHVATALAEFESSPGMAKQRY